MCKWSRFVHESDDRCLLSEEHICLFNYLGRSESYQCLTAKLSRRIFLFPKFPSFHFILSFYHFTSSWLIPLRRFAIGIPDEILWVHAGFIQDTSSSLCVPSWVAHNFQIKETELKSGLFSFASRRYFDIAPSFPALDWYEYRSFGPFIILFPSLVLKNHLKCPWESHAASR